MQLIATVVAEAAETSDRCTIEVRKNAQTGFYVVTLLSGRTIGSTAMLTHAMDVAAKYITDVVLNSN